MSSRSAVIAPDLNASAADPRDGAWLDGDRLINCLSIALVACLIPVHPLSENLYLTLSVIGFAGVSFANHLFPRRLHRLTHGVKAAYTHVLFASIATSWLAFPVWLTAAIIVSVFDLLPLVLRAPTLRAASEGIGAMARWAAIVYGFWLIAFPVWLIAVFGGCSVVYYWERRRRIRSGRRFDYGLPHSLEHVAVWLYLFALNAERLNLVWVWWSSLAIVGSVALSMLVAGIWTNIATVRNLERDLPEWFDPRLRPFIKRKSRDNALSHRWQHYVIKPFTPKMTGRRVRWIDIEAMVGKIALPARFDAIVGVLSGGAFITPLVARRHDIETVHYAHSRLWSKLSLLRNILTSLRYYLGSKNNTEARFLDDELDLSGQRVLVVDDSVCTGTTLAAVSALCRERGARDVKTMALFCHPDHRTDYLYHLSGTPLVWPWGWEAD